MNIKRNFSDVIRVVLIAGMAVIALMLVMEWSAFQDARRPQMETSTTLSHGVPGTPSVGETPGAEAPNQEIPQLRPSDVPAPAAENAPTSQAQLVTVRTDTLEVLIDTYGGDIVKVALLRYDAELNSAEPLVLLNRNQSMTYIAQSGLVGTNGTDLSGGERPIFTVQQPEFVLSEDSNRLDVDLLLQQGNVSITKRYTFHRGDNLVDLNYLIDNRSAEPWSAHLYGQIKRDDHSPGRRAGFGVGGFLGAATTNNEDNYAKFNFGKVAKRPVSFDYQGGWVAMVQHYFISAWIPEADETNHFFLHQLPNTNQYVFGFRGPAHQVAPGQQGVISAEFYAGPKDIHRLKEIAPYLERTIDYGPLWFIGLPLFYFLSWIHGFVGNWGVAIILLVVAVKAAFFHLAATGFRSMARMRKFAPKMQELKERYGDNRQKFSEEMIKLYKKEKINPMKGCLPMLLQMPVFIALYWVLMENVELRHASFLWLRDLSVKDPFFILPLIYGATFWFQMRLNPPAQDPTQQKIMQMMPIFFTVMFMFFPSGLVLYWVTNGVLSIAQQWFITRQIERGDNKAA